MQLKLIVLLGVAFFCQSATAAAPFLEGHVRDEVGRPIKGATIRILDCIGTCLGGKTVLSDADGHYVFENRPFRNHPLLTVSMPGRYEVSRRQTGPAIESAEADVARRVDFVLGTPAALTLRLSGDVPDDWTQDVLIRSGKDVALHRYDVDANYSRGYDFWNFDLLPRNESIHFVVVRRPVVIESDDRKEMRERERASRRAAVEIVSSAVRLTEPQRYNVQASIELDETSGVSFLRLESVTNVLGEDCTAELVSDDPIFGPSASPTDQKDALALLKRVEAAAAPWNARPAKSIVSYEYDFFDQNNATTHVIIDHNSPSGPSWSDISRLRGFAYMPPLRWLFSQPDNVVFHRVDIGDDEAELRYRLKSARGLGAGLGIGPGWNGFFTTKFSVGTVRINPRNATVLEHRFSNGLLGGESVETFDNYVAVEDGYAPGTMRIQSGGFDFQLAFRIHSEKLWLLEQASRKGQDQPAARIDNVQVNLAK